MIPVFFGVYLFLLQGNNKQPKKNMIRFSLVFDRKKEIKTRKKGLVQIECYQNGLRKYKTTKLYLAENEWNFKRNEPRDSTHQIFVRKKLSDIENYQREVVREKGDITLSDLDQYQKKVENNTPQIPKHTFTDFCHEELKKQSSVVKHISYQNDSITIKLLLKYKPTIEFEDLTYSFIDGFETFLVSQKNNPTTRNKRHIIVGKYILKALKNKHITYNPYTDFVKPKALCRETYLTPDERKRFEDLIFEPTEKVLKLVRDMYLFSSVTGLRWGDISRLKKENFLKTDKGISLDVVTQKTGDRLTLPLENISNGLAQKIIEDYWPKTDKAVVFHIAGGTVNRKLKVLAKLAKINKHITFHSSRHTAATNITQVLGIRMAQGILCHRDIRTTQRYTHISQTERDKAIENANWN